MTCTKHVIELYQSTVYKARPNKVVSLSEKKLTIFKEVSQILEADFCILFVN